MFLAATGHVDVGQLQALPRSAVRPDSHCVTKWSKLGRPSLARGAARHPLEDVDTAAEFALVRARTATTRPIVPLEDLLDGRARIVHEFDGEALDPWHGGPARLLVPSPVLRKSAKWVTRIDLLLDDEPGFW